MTQDAARTKYDPARLAHAGFRALAGRHLLAFMRFCWWSPSPFKIGRHTRAICDRLTRAVEDFRRGKSTYLIVEVPFRHGKSEMCSVALPAYFLGRCADMQPSIISTGYGQTLVSQFSAKSRAIIMSPRYQEVFPGVRVGKSTDALWKIEGSVGAVTVSGLGGAITGSGGNLIIIDDYCKSRAEAVSQTTRAKAWDAFRNDVFTRQNAPAAIVLVVATPWHVDDLIGRLKKKMEEDADFPRFEELRFPARGDNGEYDYLFPELFGPGWYDAQRAVLGRQAAALLDCRPQIEGGNRFNPDNCKIHTTLDGWPKGREARAWDLASSARERDGDDPDWTFGVRGTTTKWRDEEGVDHRELWIREMTCCRAEAPERNRLIRDTAFADGPGVSQCIEAFGAYKDAYAELKRALAGVSIVRKAILPGDKTAKAAPMEPLFDAGAVHIYAPGCPKVVLDRWREDFAAFPDGAHDDAVDATAVLYHATCGTGSGFII